jgi:xanthine dehydrogenase YagR molybdenum-binding subunit
MNMMRYCVCVRFEDAIMSSATINGRSHILPTDPDALLVDVLRDTLQLTGTKLVCGAGVCGACTVLLDGVPVCSCLLPANAAAGKSITTVEGIGAEKLHPIQKAFMALDALQCGFCTPGFIVEATAFHDRWRKEHGSRVPSREAIGAAMSGHLCRCSAYDNIFRAIGDACAGRYDGNLEISPRIEARQKVTGAAKYTVDIQHEGQLEGRILRSPHAHARVTSLDLTRALAMPGVKAAVSLLGKDSEVRFVGQQIAAVAAVDRRTAAAALAAIAVVYETLPSVIGVKAAVAEGAPLVFAGKSSPPNGAEGPLMPSRWRGNVRGPNDAFSHKKTKAKTWIAEARAANNPFLYEATFHTAVQQHTSLEPHAAIARFDGERLTVHVSTQAVFELRGKIAKQFKLNVENVRVVAEHIGGGFGSKGALGAETTVAIQLAQLAMAPVRVAFDRHEELSVAGYRPAAEMRISILPGADGALKALSMRSFGDSGVAVNSTISGLARLIYPAEAKELIDFDVVNNMPPGAPFRGPGGPPMAFALEQAIDEAALRMKVDPIQLRKRWDTYPNRLRLYDWAASLDCWRSISTPAKQTGRYRRGVGVAAGYWLYLWQLGSKVELSVQNGRLVASTAVQDIGTGIRSVIADAVAREFGVEPHEVEVRIGDSKLPEGPGSGGSRTTASVLPPLLLAVSKLKSRLEQNSTGAAIPGSNAPWRAMIAASPDITVNAERPEDDASRAGGQRSLIKEGGLMGTIFGWMMRRFSHMAIGAGAPSSVQVVEVEVDTLLGNVRVVKVHTGIAVGKLAAPALARGQATGAIIQGLGYALYEAREVDPRTGDILSAGLEDYRIPGIADTPEIEVYFDEGGFDHVLGGSVGIGEVATVPTAAALANAVRNAIGVRPTEIPLRPDRVLALLRSGNAA